MLTTYNDYYALLKKKVVINKYALPDVNEIEKFYNKYIIDSDLDLLCIDVYRDAKRIISETQKDTFDNNESIDLFNESCLKKAKINQINELIEKNKIEMQSMYYLLAKDALLFKDKIKQYEDLDNQITDFKNVINQSMKTVDLISDISNDNSISQNVENIIDSLTIEQIVGDSSIKNWIDDRRITNMSYHNISSIIDINKYNKILKDVYQGIDDAYINSSSFIERIRNICIYLYDNRIVDYNFKTDDLKQDYLNYKNKE